MSRPQNEKVNALLDSWKEDYAGMLSRWLSVPSLKADPQDGAPFGPEVRRMLDMAMKDAADMGFDTRNFDGYAGDVTLKGSSDEAIAVLAHLDVVPAGDGWKTDPFVPTRIGDRIYARGTGDDKGPALCSLFAMKAIREAGIPLRRSVRLVLGCDEESGWDDMAYYTAHTQMPEVGFSPDATFPLINTEKGMLAVRAHAKVSSEGLQVKELMTGERTNVIPGESTAVVEGGEEIAAKVRTLADVYGSEHDGASLGIACRDEISGPLTCNMGILHLVGDEIHCTFDNRCPVKADLEHLRDTLIAHIPEFTIDSVKLTAPHHVPADSELVTSLLAAYTEESGLIGEPESTGGGTYAKVLKQGVAFGAGFPDDEDLAHQANEFVDLNKMILSAKIYANALLRLCAD